MTARPLATLERHCLFTRSCSIRHRPAPPRGAIRMMLAELECELDERSLMPVTLTCEAWPVPRASTDEHSALARIRIEAEQGALKRSLASWYEWQHPTWQWTSEPQPALEHVCMLGAQPLLQPAHQALRSSS